MNIHICEHIIPCNCFPDISFQRYVLLHTKLKWVIYFFPILYTLYLHLNTYRRVIENLRVSFLRWKADKPQTLGVSVNVLNMAGYVIECIKNFQSCIYTSQHILNISIAIFCVLVILQCSSNLVVYTGCSARHLSILHELLWLKRRMLYRRVFSCQLLHLCAF